MKTSEPNNPAVAAVPPEGGTPTMLVPRLIEDAEWNRVNPEYPRAKELGETADLELEAAAHIQKLERELAFERQERNKFEELNDYATQRVLDLRGELSRARAALDMQDRIECDTHARLLASEAALARVEALHKGLMAEADRKLEESEAARRGVEQELRNIVNAKRFDVECFEDDTAFADWAQSRARFTLSQSQALGIPAAATQRFPQQALDAPSGQGCSEQRSRRDHD